MIVVEYRDRWARSQDLLHQREAATHRLMCAATRYAARPSLYEARVAFEAAADALAATPPNPAKGDKPDVCRMAAWERLRVWALVVEREERKEARRARA